MSSDPIIILVQPQLGENIGAAARAMMNCGLTELRLVAPRDGWPNPMALANASGASRVIEGARLFPDTASAIADLQRVYATTLRHRGMIKPVVTPRQAAAELRAVAANGQRAGILFGPERAGLTNDDVSLADTIITAPLNPEFSSLNLGQAVLLLAYEWWLVADNTPARQLVTNQTAPADKAQLMNFINHLEAALVESGFLRHEEKRPSMMRNLRNFFQRATPTEQELRTLHGIIKDLSRGQHDRS